VAGRFEGGARSGRGSGSEERIGKERRAEGEKDGFDFANVGEIV